ncbi:hypothetical protein [Bacillus infantis]|uniref:Uncharacterized protein n=1 Tax=Bacillus infantis TaxID=324767 RepID=A0A5D4RAM4_9BACI|nr:hypothetical protein [Bacillus infantis]TYS48523.1 hypothetical protein FZD51_10385 [Bacillus infantis]
MLGIKNYKPVFYGDSLEFINNHGNRLRSMVNKNLCEMWTVHEVSSGEFWSDCPVVLLIGGQQLEFCSFKDQIAVSWNAIDLNESIIWYGSRDLRLEWRKNAIKGTSAFTGSPVEGADLIEAAQEGHPITLRGLGLKTAKGYIALFNEFDETVLTFEKNEECLYTEI